MAIYYSRLSLICRSQGHSAVAAAAYRAGVRLHDARTDQSHNYSKKRGVLDATMLAPAAAPWAIDLEHVWSRAEKAEVRRNARTGRELIVALPAELSQAEQLLLAHRLGQDLVDRYGVAVLVATHAPDKKSDDRNVHVHLLMSTRIAEPAGFGAKVRVLDDQKSGPKEAEAMRARVADRINEALAKHGHFERVDPRLLRAQAVDAASRGDLEAVVDLARTPTRHVGKEATAAVRRGEASFVAASNEEVRRDNATVQTRGLARASELRRGIQRRTQRWNQTAVRTLRAPRLRNGIGSVGTGTKATGAHAQLLNDQARLAQASARLARDTSEAYLDMLNRETERHEAAVRAYLQSVGVGEEEFRRLTHAGRRRSVAPEHIERAVAAHAAWVQTEADHQVRRRATAEAEVATARARGELFRLETSAPPAWRLRSKRQWAELRRTQRAAAAAAEQTEHRQRAVRDRIAEENHNAKQEWHTAHVALTEQLRAVPPQSTSSRTGDRSQPRPTPMATQMTATEVLNDVRAKLAHPLKPSRRPVARPGRRTSGP